ncbi:MAG TPA: hypothetical protein VII99_04915, partial [Bacteroidia bacterium]
MHNNYMTQNNKSCISFSKKAVLFFAFLLCCMNLVNAQALKISSEQNPLNFKGVISLGHPNYTDGGKMLQDVSADQVQKECQFFGGDSLIGFDFAKNAKESEKHGIKLYKEFKVFMFREEAKFIKNKYKIDKLPYEIALENAKHVPPHVLAGSCNNLDLETGDFTGWVGGSGYNSNSNAPLTLQGTAYYATNQGVYDCSDLQLISSAYGNDPVGLFAGKDPNGGNWSARLGGIDINQSSGFGCDGQSYTPARPYGGYWDWEWSNGEYLEQTFVVTAANALLSYDYAVILNDGLHNDGEQPYFHVQVTNNAGVQLSTCTNYSVQTTGGGGMPPGFTDATPNGFSLTYYKGWTANSVNLTPYIGQTVIVKFTAAGCIYGAHFAYAYIDASCGTAQILSSNGSPCAGTNVVLTAPAVAGGSYSWSGPGIVGSTTGQTATVNTGGTYQVTVTPSQGAGCAYALSIVQNFSPLPSASISSSTNVSCNGGNNGSATVSVSSGTSPFTYSWSPSGGNAATANNLTQGSYVV